MIVNIYNLFYYPYTSLSFIKILSEYNIYRKSRELQVYSLVKVHKVSAADPPLDVSSAQEGNHHTGWASTHVGARFPYGLGVEPCWGLH